MSHSFSFRSRVSRANDSRHSFGNRTVRIIHGLCPTRSLPIFERTLEKSFPKSSCQRRFGWARKTDQQKSCRVPGTDTSVDCGGSAPACLMFGFGFRDLLFNSLASINQILAFLRPDGDSAASLITLILEAPAYFRMSQISVCSSQRTTSVACGAAIPMTAPRLRA